MATLTQLAISRQGEYLADTNGARLTRDPKGLARTLEKLAADQEPLAAANKATAHMYIVNPLHDWGATINGWFDTHRPIADRIRRLRALEEAVQPPPPALGAMPARPAARPGERAGAASPGRVPENRDDCVRRLRRRHQWRGHADGVADGRIRRSHPDPPSNPRDRAS